MLRANRFSSILTHNLSEFIWVFKRFPYKAGTYNGDQVYEIQKNLRK